MPASSPPRAMCALRPPSPLWAQRLWSCAAITTLCALVCTSVMANPNGSAAKRRPAVPAQAPQGYDQHPEALRLADEIATRHHLDPAWVQQQIGQARRQPQALQFVLPPPGGAPKNWTAYRARFVEPIRLRAGREFWLAHESTLREAEARYGVPASVIVGVIGVETLYGRHTGQFRVIDALSTLALEFPASHPRAAARTAFFRDELAQFLVLTQRQGWDPQTPLGSFAGAMGWPQFMPSSWNRFAVDFDGDGRIDLFNSIPDVIGSVAHYLKAFGWQTGQPTHYPVRLQADPIQMQALMAPDILPTFSAQAFHEHGALLGTDALQHPGKLALVELQNGGAAPQYVAGTENFYAITRYNWSSYYAMAVIELGEAVQASATQR